MPTESHNGRVLVHLDKCQVTWIRLWHCTQENNDIMHVAEFESGSIRHMHK
jgi:hypothetical protein